MLNGLYRSASAMDTASQRHELISHNLANLNVDGFKRTLMSISANESIDEVSGKRSLNGSVIERVVHDFSNGQLKRTERPLDFAIDGPGFFEIQGPNGTLYSRNGAFQVSSDGVLVNGLGMPVLSDGEEIRVSSQVDPNAIQIGEDGTLSANSLPIGKLSVVEFDQMDLLAAAGSSTFRANGAVAEPSESRIVQGALESSNVSAVQEMIDMMIGMRHFEMARKTLQSISQAIQQYTNLDR